MPRSQRNDNFTDKTFTIVADILLRIIPTAPGEKEAFTYYRDGVIRSFFRSFPLGGGTGFGNKIILSQRKLTLSEGEFWR